MSGLHPMARPAKAFEVAGVIGTPMCLGYDVVDSAGRCNAAVAFAVLTQVFVTSKDEWSQFVPACAIASLMSGLTALVLLPSFIAMLLTVPGAISCLTWAAMLTTGPGDQRRHTAPSSRHARRRSERGKLSGCFSTGDPSACSISE